MSIVYQIIEDSRREKKEQKDADESFKKWIDLIRNEIIRQEGGQKRFSYRIVKKLQDEGQAAAAGNRNEGMESGVRRKRRLAIRRGYSGKPIPYGATVLRMNLPTLFQSQNTPQVRARRLEWLRALAGLVADERVEKKLPRLFRDPRVARDVFRVQSKFP